MPKVTGLGHVGLFVRDMPKMIDFYTNFLGLTLTDRGPDDRIVFLSANPASEHHEIALARSQDRHTDPQQLSFTCASLTDLKAFWQRIKDENLKVHHVTNHVNAFGCYFHDPEDNVVEVYWHTGRDYPQPCGLPLDLDMSEEELLAMNAAVPDKEPVATS
jgi:catechol-2,3-dioxygenase